MAGALLVMAPTTQQATTTRYKLDINGVDVGVLDELDLQQVAGTPATTTVKVALPALNASLLGWLNAVLAGNQPATRGEILTLDYDLNIKSVLDFADAKVTRIDFPAADAASKDPAKLWITLVATNTQQKAGTGKAATFTQQLLQKRWLPANFKLTLDGITEDTKYVSKIEPITVLIQPAPQRPTEVAKTGPLAAVPTRASGPPQAAATVSNVVLYVSAAKASSFQQWLSTGSSAARNGVLTFLQPNLQQSLYVLNLSGLMITKIDQNAAANGQTIVRDRVEMTVKGLQFSSIAP
jgi:hypothetical protein